MNELRMRLGEIKAHLADAAAGLDAGLIAHAPTDLAMFVAATEAVLEIHAPYANVRGWDCITCGVGGGADDIGVAWPCDTVEAVAGAFGV